MPCTEDVIRQQAPSRFYSVRYDRGTRMTLAFTQSIVALVLYSSVALSTLRPAQAVERGVAETTGIAPAQHFVVMYRQGPTWKAGQAMAQQALGEHYRYYLRARDEGRVFAAGPLTAVNGGLAILRMSDLDEARAFLSADPAILNGTFLAELHAWDPRIVGSGSLKQ